VVAVANIPQTLAMRARILHSSARGVSVRELAERLGGVSQPPVCIGVGASGNSELLVWQPNAQWATPARQPHARAHGGSSDDAST
jgi:hypothetical protein